MDLKYLLKLDHIADRVGDRNPKHVLEYLDITFTDPGRSLDGFIMRCKNHLYCGVNRGFSESKFNYGTMHEISHVVCDHLDTPGFMVGKGLHADRGIFSSYKRVASSEREANIGAADFLIDTQTILEMIGYDSVDVSSYRASMASFEQTNRDYEFHVEVARNNGSPESRIQKMEAYQQELSRMYEKLQEQAQDILNSGICFTVGEISRQFGMPEYIISYMLEALRIRGYDVSTVELPNFSDVFHKWKEGI